jgi:hypothetical protein
MLRLQVGTTAVRLHCARYKHAIAFFGSTLKT